MSAGGFAQVRRLMLRGSWGSPTLTSILLCHMMDTVLPLSTSNDFPASAKIAAETGTAFFEFIVYFASALTAQRLDRNGAVIPSAEPPRRDLRFPPISELWRQPSLLAALEAIAAAVWDIQSRVHCTGDALLCCPLCYAAGIDHTTAAEALWTLLEFHAVHCEQSGEKPREAGTSVEARQIVWTHAVAVCRNAVWNGAARAARQCVEEWVFAPGAPHAALFAPVQPDLGDNNNNNNGNNNKGDTISIGDVPAPAVQVGGDVRSLRGFILTQCCLLAQDEVAAASTTETTTRTTTTTAARSRGGSDPYSNKAHRGNMEIDEEVVSSLSGSSIDERGDAELCASIAALRDAAPSLGSAEAFAAIATNAPLHCTDGVPLLHWACEAGREAAVRLMLAAWLDTYGPKRTARTHREGDEWNEAFAKEEEEKEAQGRDGECSTRYLRVDFASDLVRGGGVGRNAPFSEANTKDMRTGGKRKPLSSTRAIRCAALRVPVGPYAEPALSFAVRGGSATIARQLLLFGATHHIDPTGKRKKNETNAELSALLRDPGAALDPSEGPLRERLRTALCASAAADTLAAAAVRLWAERACAIGPDDTAAYRRAHDGVLRLVLAAMELDPHNISARSALRDVLARKAVDGVLPSYRYAAAVRRMRTQLEKSPPGQIAESDNNDNNDEAQGQIANSDSAYGDGPSPATIATDERQRAAFALVNCASSTSEGTRPLWVRLPRGVDVEQSLRVAGGLYGIVDGPVPPSAPVERGDLVLFSLRGSDGRFDATRIIRPRDGAVLDVPCVRSFHNNSNSSNGANGANGEVKAVQRVRLRCAMAPAPVFAFDEDRAAADPLLWMDTAANAHSNVGASGNGTVSGDAVERILNCRLHAMRWDDVRRFGQRPLWLREVRPGTTPVWRMDGASGGVIFAAAEFPAPAHAGVDDPFGAEAEAVFMVRRNSIEAAAVCGAAFRVAGVLPAWGWE